MSTYSPSLRIELITTGDQAGTWGTTTNTNLGTLIEAGITGYTSVAVIAADQAFTALYGAADESRNAVIALTTTTGANFNVYAPPAEKTYIIYNASSYTATVYNSTVIGNTTAAGTGVAVPAGKTMTIWSDGTNFAVQNNHFPAISLTTDLAVVDGGTGASTASGARSNLGAAASGANSDITSLSGLTTALSIAQGGTAATTASGARTSLGATTIGGNMFTLTNPSAVTFPRFNADNTVSALDAATFRAAIGANTGSVTSVALTTPTGLTVAGSPITTSGTLAISLQSGYSIPTTASQTNWNSAYGWLSTFGSAGQVLTSTGSGWAPASLPAGMVYPGAGIAVSTGSAWTTSLTAPSGAVVGTTDTQTLTNKRITSRVSSAASVTSPLAWNSDSFDQYAINSLANSLTINADAGTPTDGQKMVFRINDNGTARALTWTTGTAKSFRAVGTSLPTTTVANKTLYVGCIYNSNATRWDVITVVQEF